MTRLYDNPFKNAQRKLNSIDDATFRTIGVLCAIGFDIFCIVGCYLHNPSPSIDNLVGMIIAIILFTVIIINVGPHLIKLIFCIIEWILYIPAFVYSLLPAKKDSYEFDEFGDEVRSKAMRNKDKAQVGIRYFIDREAKVRINHVRFLD